MAEKTYPVPRNWKLVARLEAACERIRATGRWDTAHNVAVRWVYWCARKIGG